MIIAFVDNGRLDVFNSATGKIVSGEIKRAGFEHQPALPDSRLDVAIGLLEDLAEKVDKIMDTQDTVATEVAALKSNMVDLHSGVSGIQSRLDTAIAAAAAAPSTDPTVLADLHGVNADLKTLITGLAASAATPASSGSASVAGAASADPASAPQPVVEPPAVPAVPVAAPVVFDASNAAPNLPGGRNSSQLPNFDPAHPETP